MNKFFANKYPVTYGWDKDNKPINFPIGTIFTISAINGNCFVIEPINIIEGVNSGLLLIDANMLNIGFNGQDYICQ